MNVGKVDPIASFPNLEPLESRLLLCAEVPFGPALAVAPVAAPVAELESNGGPSNNDIAIAEVLAFSSLLPAKLAGHIAGPEQASVLGTADGAGDAGELYSSSAVVFAKVAYPQAYNLDFTNAIAPGSDGFLIVTANANLAGAGQYLTLEAEGMNLGDLFVTGGAANSAVSTQVVVTQAQLATLAADGTISFTLRPSAAVTASRFGYVSADLAYSGVSAGGTGDFYRMDLSAGESVAVAVQSLSAGELNLSLFDAAGTLLVDGAAGTENAAAAIAGYTAAQDGAYYVRVSGTGQYNLTVNRNAAMDLGSNDSLATAQALSPAMISGRQWVTGQVGAQGPSGADTDYYTVTLSADTLLKVRAFAAGSPGLRSVVRIYDSSGNLVAKNSSPQAVYRVPHNGGGTYYVQVVAVGGTSGDYLLSLNQRALHQKAKAVKAAAPSLKPAAGIFDGDILRCLKAMTVGKKA
jgi:hypothetical protein